MFVLLGVVTVIDEKAGIDGRPRWSTGYAAHAAGEVVADDELIDRRGHESGQRSGWRQEIVSVRPHFSFAKHQGVSPG
jgi:hypothetical protein